MNSEIKTQIAIITAAFLKIRDLLFKEPKLRLTIKFAYYSLKTAVWIIKLIK